MESKTIFEGYFPELDGRFRIKLYERYYWVQFHEGGTPLKDYNWTNVHQDQVAVTVVIRKALAFLTQAHDDKNCNFCGKSPRQVKKLVMGVLGTRICDECLTVSFATMIESPVKFQEPGTKPPSPQTTDWCPTCKQGWDCAKHDQESRAALSTAQKEIVDLSEALDNVRIALGLDETHYLVIHNMVEDLVKTAAKAQIHLLQTVKALSPLKVIADAYDENNLDDEARKRWGEDYEHENQVSPEKIELYSGRGGTQLLTLQHCFDAREALKD